MDGGSSQYVTVRRDFFTAANPGSGGGINGNGRLVANAANPTTTTLTLASIQPQNNRTLTNVIVKEVGMKKETFT